MKRSVVLVGLALLVPVMVGGCSDQITDVGLPGYLLGKDPPPDSGAPIRRLGPDKMTYPNLGTVPDRPKDIPTAEQATAEQKRLEDERAANRAAADALRATPLP